MHRSVGNVACFRNTRRRVKCHLVLVAKRVLQKAVKVSRPPPLRIRNNILQVGDRFRWMKTSKITHRGHLSRIQSFLANCAHGRWGRDIALGRSGIAFERRRPIQLECAWPRSNLITVGLVGKPRRQMACGAKSLSSSGAAERRVLTERLNPSRRESSTSSCSIDSHSS